MKEIDAISADVKKALINKARNLIDEKYKEGRHHIACALITEDGSIHKAVHLETYVGRAAICAEAVAIGMAMSSDNGPIKAIVSVNKEGKVVSPCGICRELLSDYCPDALVLIPNTEKGVVGVKVTSLLPERYHRD